MEKKEKIVDELSIKSLIVDSLLKKGINISQKAISHFAPNDLLKVEQLKDAFVEDGVQAILLQDTDDRIFDLFYKAFGNKPEHTRERFLMILQIDSNVDNRCIISWPVVLNSPMVATAEGEVSPEGKVDMLFSKATQIDGTNRKSQGVSDLDLMEYFVRTITTKWNSINNGSSANMTNSSGNILLNWSKPYVFMPSGEWISSTSHWEPPSGQRIELQISTLVAGQYNEVLGNPDSQDIHTAVIINASTNGPIPNSTNRGWENSEVIIKVNFSEGFNPINGSPQNTNGQHVSEVTTSKSFDFGVTPDGPTANGGYSSSTTQSNTISDWEVIKLDAKSWRYVDSGAKGRIDNGLETLTTKFEGSKIKLNSGNPLATNSLDVYTDVTGHISPPISGQVPIDFYIKYATSFHHLSSANYLYSWLAKFYDNVGKIEDNPSLSVRHFVNMSFVNSGQ